MILSNEDNLEIENQQLDTNLISQIEKFPEQILEKKKFGNTLRYKVRWNDTTTSWVAEINLASAKELILEFNSK